MIRLLSSCLLGLSLAGPAQAGRFPVYVDADAAAGVHTGLAPIYDAGAVGSFDVKLGGGFWLRQRVAGFGQIGVMQTVGRSTDLGSTVTGSITDQFRLAPVRGGIKANLWPRPFWLQLNAVAAISYVSGFHELYASTTLARHKVSSLGGAGGVEWMAVRGKQIGATARALYVVQPVDVPVNQGFLAQGPMDLGGLELSVGLVVFVGPPR